MVSDAGRGEVFLVLNDSEEVVGLRMIAKRSLASAGSRPMNAAKLVALWVVMVEWESRLAGWHCAGQP